MLNKIKNNEIILVTGGAGFIGSNIIEFLLNEGKKVRCLDNLSTGNKENLELFIENPNFEFIEGSIEDYETCLEACKGVTYVSHQAAWGSVPRSIEQPLYYNKVNVEGTLNMLEAAVKNKIKKFVYASSSSVYGDSKTLPKKEGDEGKVLSPYALTKKVDEDYAKLYSSLYGLETVGLRYFNIFGKRQDPNGAYAAVIPKFVTSLINNKEIIINGDGLTSRDFTHVNNVISANILAMTSSSEVTGVALNIASGGRITLNELFDILSSRLNKNIRPTYAKERRGDVKHSNAQISLASDMIGYEPIVSFEEGIDKSIEWYKNNL